MDLADLRNDHAPIVQGAGWAITAFDFVLDDDTDEDMLILLHLESGRQLIMSALDGWVMAYDEVEGGEQDPPSEVFRGDFGSALHYAAGVASGLPYYMRDGHILHVAVGNLARLVRPGVSMPAVPLTAEWLALDPEPCRRFA
jgi:hypothetical protein